MIVNDCVAKSKNFSKPEQIVILLHGSSGRGEHLLGACNEFFVPNIDNSVFLMPNGEIKDPGSPENCSWWQEITAERDECREGLDAACPHVKEYVAQMSIEYGCDKVCLVGFSQGALVAFEMMYLMKISKVISYCGEFIVPQGKEPVSKPECLLVHSDDDPVVRYPEAVRARKDLAKLGVPAELVTHHNVGHGVSAEGWKIGAAFLSGARKLKKPCLLRRLFCRGV